ncbi:MAG: carboxypeptidase regulatory-like domain-containing protein [Gemmatimonadaceae bacterium]
MMSRFGRARCLGALQGALVGLFLVSAAVAGAQQGTIRGRVVDKSSNTALPRAEIIVLSSANRSVITDSIGGYVFAALPAGTVRLLVRAPLFPPTEVIVELSVGQDLDRTIVLDSTAAGRAAQMLPALAVTAAAPVDRRLIDFERRRRTGRGQYLTRDDIEKSGASSVQDAVRALRGVAVECGGGMGCFIRMVRAPMQCPPDYVVDRRVDNHFGPSTPVRDIEALEVYTGPSDVPGEFAGRTAGCGVIVIWTRAGPPPPRTP